MIGQSVWMGILKRECDSRSRSLKALPAHPWLDSSFLRGAMVSAKNSVGQHIQMGEMSVVAQKEQYMERQREYTRPDANPCQGAMFKHMPTNNNLTLI